MILCIVCFCAAAAPGVIRCIVGRIRGSIEDRRHARARLSRFDAVLASTEIGRQYLADRDAP